jgi:hypothetical protein
MITGNIDSVSKQWISGWAADRNSTSTALKLKVVINKKDEVFFTANIYREDVFQAIGSGAHGFYVPLPDKLRVGKNTFQIMTLDEQCVLKEKTLVVDSTSNENMVERGADDWLFLTNDSNRTNEVIDGTIRLSEQQLTSYDRLFFIRELLSEHFGFNLLNVIVPDKNVVCNHHKLVPLKISENRPALEILKKVAGTAKTVIYPINACSEQENFYFKTDTHPSYIGQRKLFDMILNALDIEPTYQFNEKTSEVSGDLGSKIRPPITEQAYKTNPKFETIEIIDNAVEAFKSGSRLTGTWTHHTAKSGHAKKVYIFGTSTAFYMRELFFSQFQDVFFTWHTALDMDIIRKYKPDYVVGIMTERFLTQVPNDITTKINI